MGRFSCRCRSYRSHRHHLEQLRCHCSLHPAVRREGHLAIQLASWGPVEEPHSHRMLVAAALLHRQEQVVELRLETGSNSMSHKCRLSIQWMAAHLERQQVEAAGSSSKIVPWHHRAAGLCCTKSKHRLPPAPVAAVGRMIHKEQRCHTTEQLVEQPEVVHWPQVEWNNSQRHRSYRIRYFASRLSCVVFYFRRVKIY